MLGKYRIASALILVVLAALPGCNTNLDDPKGPPVVLEVTNVTIPPITGAIGPSGCVLTVTNGSGTFKDLPKNQYASSSPFNDIILKGVTITYVWDDGAGVPGPATYGITGVIPANGSGTAQFAVISLTDLTGREGHTANLSLTFFGNVFEGSAVSVTTGGVLNVGSCL